MNQDSEQKGTAREDSGVVRISERGRDAVNLAAIAGVLFAVIAGLLYVTLFHKVGQLTGIAVEQPVADTGGRRPSSSEPAPGPRRLKVQHDTPSLIRVSLIGGSAALLNLVSLLLSAMSLWGPQRYRTAGYAGLTASTLMLFGILTVILLSAVIR